MTSGTLLVKHKPDRVRAGFNGDESVFEIRDSANFDPSHKCSRWSFVVGPQQDLR